MLPADFEREDPLGAARGCLFGVVIGIVLWGVIIAMFFLGG
jgi:tetrahydromethanopterin S-methyltransferase subunit G